MAKLGYTWYPKDWGNSESVFELNLSERGLYRELIDLAMFNDNKTEIKLDVWIRKFAIDIDSLKSILGKLSILNLIEIKGDILFIPSCESRLNLVRGGSNGGKKSKPTIKPIQKPFESLNENKSKPMSNQIEIESKTKNKPKEKENNNSIFYTDLLNSQQWLESLSMNNKNKFNLIQVKEKLLVFKNNIDLKFDVKTNKNDFASHFVSWLDTQKNEKQNVKPYFDSPA